MTSTVAVTSFVPAGLGINEIAAKSARLRQRGCRTEGRVKYFDIGRVGYLMSRETQQLTIYE